MHCISTCARKEYLYIVCRRWEYDGTEDEAVKSIPYQLQRLFLQLQVSWLKIHCSINLASDSIKDVLLVFFRFYLITVCN